MFLWRCFWPVLFLWLCHCAVRGERPSRDDEGLLGGAELPQSKFDPDAFEPEVKGVLNDMAQLKKRLKTRLAAKKPQKPSNDILNKLQLFLADPERAKEQLKLFLAQDPASIQAAIRDVMCPAGTSVVVGPAVPFDAQSFAGSLATSLMAWASSLDGKKFSDEAARIKSATTYLFASSSSATKAPLGALAAAAIQYLATGSALSRVEIKAWVAKNYASKVDGWRTADQNYQTLAAFCQSDDALGRAIAHVSRRMDPAFIVPIALVSLASVIAAVSLLAKRLRKQAEIRLAMKENKRQEEELRQKNQEIKRLEEGNKQLAAHRQQLAEEKQQLEADLERQNQEEQRKKAQQPQRSNQDIFAEHLLEYQKGVNSLFEDYEEFVAGDKLKNPGDFEELNTNEAKFLGQYTNFANSLPKDIEIYSKKGLPQKLKKSFGNIEKEAKRLWPETWTAKILQKNNKLKSTGELSSAINTERERRKQYKTALEGLFSKEIPSGVFTKTKSQLLGENLSYDAYVEYPQKKEGSHEFYHFLKRRSEEKAGGSFWVGSLVQTVVDSTVATTGLLLSEGSALLDDLRRLFGRLGQALAKKERLRPLYD